jgi:hypothetical protein
MGKARIRGIFSKGVKKTCGHTDVITSLRSHQNDQNRKDPKRRRYESTGTHFHIRKETYLAFVVLVVFQLDLVKNEYPPQPMGQPYLMIKSRGTMASFFFALGNLYDSILNLIIAYHVKLISIFITKAK